MDLDGDLESAHRFGEVVGGFFESRVVGDRLKELGIRGLEPGGGPNKDTDTSFRYKFQAIGPGAIPYATKIEISFRNRHPDDDAVCEPVAKEFTSRCLDGESFDVRHYSWVAALRQKIGALAGRSTPQARDVFDIYVLASNATESAPYARLRAALTGGEIEAAKNAAYSLTYEGFAGQVLEFLDDDDRARFERREKWDEIRRETIELIEEISAAEESE